MIKETDIISLDEVNGEQALRGGGKFAGLAKLKPLIDEYNRQYDLNLAVPQTYAISMDIFERYDIANNGAPEELVNKAMEVMVKLGGNVAVRSSADVEDGETSSYSGQFDSVLSVKTKSDMRQALNTVYASAQNVPDSKMAVVLQSMIETPKIAGVAYSESWYRDPFIVLNYTENKLADKLIARGDKEGRLFAVGKFFADEQNNVHNISLDYLSNPDYKPVFMRLGDITPRWATETDKKQYHDLFVLAALTNQLENDLGYPVDMEFAVSKNGSFNILQQRPYYFPKTYTKEIDLNTTTYFNASKPIIEGTVGFINAPSPWNAKKDYDINIWKQDETVRIFTKDSVGVRLAFSGSMRYHKTPLSAQYNHFGNMSRESLDFSEMETFGRTAEFAHIKEGDYMRVNLVTGEFRVRPVKDNIPFNLIPLKNIKE